jgi:glycosyltransferase involved in cell wall biosynthesis
MALRDARSKYIMRVDADDQLLPQALAIMVTEIKNNPDVMVIYPAFIPVTNNNRVGYIEKNSAHHIGGALIRNWVYQEIKFCDGMRHLDGQYFFKKLVELGHRYKEIDCATWVYLAKEGSLTTHDDEDKKLAEKIVGVTGKPLN